MNLPMMRMEGLQEFKDKQQIAYMVDMLNRDLKKKTEKKKKRREKMKLKDQSWLYISIVIIIILLSSFPYIVDAQVDAKALISTFVLPSQFFQS